MKKISVSYVVLMALLCVAPMTLQAQATSAKTTPASVSQEPKRLLSLDLLFEDQVLLSNKFFCLILIDILSIHQ